MPPPLEWQLLVVANACTDQTARTAGRFATTLPVRVVEEPVAGLSIARNRALAEAKTKGGPLVFTDDDVAPAPGWLAAYEAAFSHHSANAFFGGRVLPVFESEAPGWLRDPKMDLLDGMLVCYDLGGEERRISGNDILPVGASMGLGRAVVERAEPFRTDLGVVGKSLRRGEDTEYLGRLRSTGNPGFYLPQATLHHRVAPERLSLAYAWRYGLGCFGGKGSLPEAGLFLIKALHQMTLRRGDRVRQCLIRAGMEFAAFRTKTRRPCLRPHPASAVKTSGEK